MKLSLLQQLFALFLRCLLFRVLKVSRQKEADYLFRPTQVNMDQKRFLLDVGKMEEIWHGGIEGVPLENLEDLHTYVQLPGENIFPSIIPRCTQPYIDFIGTEILCE